MKRSELLKILKANGCYFIREGNNHEIWHSIITGNDFPRVAAFRERYSAGDTAKNFHGGRYNKMKYEYPAVISYDHQDRVYYVNFPDISNCFTDGLTLREALDNAEDVLNLMLSNAEAKHESLPDPSEINSICLNAGEIVSMIQADTDLYSKIAV